MFEFDVEIKTSGGTKTVPIETRLLTERKIFLAGDITIGAVELLIKKIMYLQSDVKTSVDLFLSCSGGDLSATLLAIEVLNNCPMPVRVICLGQCTGAGLFLLACGPTGMRYAMECSVFRLKECEIIGVSEKAGFNASKQELSFIMKRRLNQKLSESTGHPLNEIEEAIATSRWFDTCDAVSFGLCDGVINSF